MQIQLSQRRSAAHSKPVQTTLRTGGLKGWLCGPDCRSTIVRPASRGTAGTAEMSKEVGRRPTISADSGTILWAAECRAGELSMELRSRPPSKRTTRCHTTVTRTASVLLTEKKCKCTYVMEGKGQLQERSVGVVARAVPSAARVISDKAA